MSFHVYVSRPGFKDEPISGEEWVAAARNCARLSVVERSNRRGVSHHEVMLVGSGKFLWLTPHGLIHAQDPPADLVEVMFELAAALGASVYSEKLKRYDSVADWWKRTHQYRGARSAATALEKGQRRRRQTLWGLLVLFSLSAGWLFAEHKHALAAWFGGVAH